MADQEGIGFVDRGTLGAWRVLNLVGWNACALISALYFRFAGEAAGVLIQAGSAGVIGELPPGYAAIVGAVSSLVAGAALGTIVGARVYRWQVASSGVVATMAALVWWIGFAGAADAARGTIGLGTAALMIPVSIVVTRRSRRSRAARAS